MKKIGTLVTVFFMLISLLTFGTSAEQEKEKGKEIRWSGSGGWDVETNYSRMYDPKTVETISGEVVSVGIITPMKKMESKSLNSPDETRTFEKGKLELIKIGGATIGRVVFEPGWRWSTHVKPIAKTEWCETPHFQYHVSGTLHVVMADGTEKDLKPGDVSLLPSGHDAWVVGDEPVVVVDFQGMLDYAKEAAEGK